MKWSEISYDQLRWLNQQYAQTARRMHRIVRKLDAAKLTQDDPIYCSIVAALHVVYTVCEITHQRLEQRRPAVDAFKPGGYERSRLLVREQERRQQALVERGRADPSKTTVSEEGYEDRPY